jgi:hypothetical protein
MVKILEQSIAESEEGISLRDAAVKTVKGAETKHIPVRNYRIPGNEDRTVYACDASCDNCHCATYG